MIQKYIRVIVRDVMTKLLQNFYKNYNESEFKEGVSRIAVGTFVRTGSYLEKNVVVMPSFINIGAYVANIVS